jgi:hypothetical protein
MVEIVRFPGVPSKDDTLHAMIQGFLDNSGEPELSVEDVYRMMIRTPRNECIFFVIQEDGEPRGYLFAQSMPDEYGERVVLVQSTFVKGVRENFWQDMVRKLGGFAKEQGCDTMYFTTRRDPKAFARLLRTPWTLDSHVMKHKFHGS